MRRIPERRVLSKVFNTLRERGTLLSAHVSSEPARQQHVEEEENIIEMVQPSPTTSTRKLYTRLGVSRTCVWGTLHDDLYPFHPQRVQNLHPGDSAMRVEFCHRLNTNRKFSINTVTYLIDALPGGSSVDAVRYATVEEAMFSACPIDWRASSELEPIIFVACNIPHVTILFNDETTYIHPSNP
jgi:hypothetical protein